ncbi:hypothetical protein ACLESD_25780 [Pyxidicoccus sp. 3LFB2]
MKDTIEQRLATLDAEHEAGQKMLAELDAKRMQLVQTMLRIEGARQVLKELLNGEPPGASVTDIKDAPR